jgi:hypothetical protein
MTIQRQLRILESSDFQSPTWVKLRTYFELKKAELQQKLAAKNIPERDADFVRGDLRRIEFMLSLEKPATADVEDDPSFIVD